MERRGQVTIFVIIGIAVIVIVGLLLFFLGKNLSPNSTKNIEENQEEFLSQCIKDSLREKVQIISEQGGYIHPKLKIEFRFQGEEFVNISYLCYQENYYLPCINQEPMFISHLKKEIKEEIKIDLEDCFEELKNGLDKKGYSTQINLEDFEVELRNGKILINTESLIKYAKSEDTKVQEDLEFSIVSNFYNLVIVAQEITNQEAKFCNFEQTGYMLLYPEFEIEKFRTGDSTTIYTIKYKKTGERFRFAIRSCVIPPGF